MGDLRDIELRNAALEHVRELQRRYDDLVPVRALADGFQFRGRRVSFGSFFSGIFHPKELEGPAALCLVTAPPKSGRPPPYDDAIDDATGRLIYRFRAARTDTATARLQAAADSRALVAAHELAVPVIHFRGIAPGQYAVVAPAFVIAVNEQAQLVELEAGLPLVDTTPAGLVSGDDVRRYAARSGRAAAPAPVPGCRAARLHDPLRGLPPPRGLVAPGGAHHRGPRPGRPRDGRQRHLPVRDPPDAYDRNLLGIDPGGVVDIARRLLDEIDGPMLRSGLQEFHGAVILQPRRRDEQPDPERLELRYEQFVAVS